MQKQSLFLLLGAVILATAGALVVPQLLTDPEPPVMRWSEDDEQDVPDEEPDAEVATAAGRDPGEALVERTEVAIADDRNDRIDVTLRGRVIDRFQAPVGEAMVWLDFGRGGPGGRGGAANRQRRVPEPVQTDAEGRFAFQGQTFRNLRVALQVAHPNFAPGLFDKDIGAVTSAVDLGDLVLHGGGEVRGRVTDLAGNGVADAELRAQPENGNTLRQLRDRDKLLSPLRTDQNGFFRGQHLAAGDWSLTVTAKRHTEGRSPVFAIEADQSIDIDDIRLGPGYEITGTVRDVAGKPVAKATVVAQSEARNRQGGRGQGPGGGGPGGGGGGQGGFFGLGNEHRAVTAADGTFLLEHLPAGPMRIDTDAPGYLDLRLEGIDPTLAAPLDLTLQDGLRVEGVVQETDARPVTRFAFRVVRLRNLPLPGQAPIDVEALMARMRDPNLSDAERSELRAQAGNLREAFAGRGGPMGRGDRGGGGGGDEPRGGRGNNDLGKIESHPGGEFVATGLQEGVFELHLQSPDHARYRSAEFELRAGAVPARLSVVVDAGVYVAGIVRDDSDRPVANARVELRTPNAFEGMGRRGRPGSAEAGNGGAAANEGRPDFAGMARDAMRQFAGAQLTLETTTDAEGEFVIKHAPRGSYRLRAEARGYASADSETFELASDRSGVDLRLGNLGSLFGAVRGLGAAEFATARVAAVPMGGQGGGIGAMFGRGRGGGGGGGNPFQGVGVAADGSYRIDDLVPGDYLVRSWVGSSQELLRELMPRFTDGTLTADIRVRAGEPTRLDLQVARPRLGTVAGTVLHNGAPAAGFQVELVRAEDTTNATNETGGGRQGGGRGRGGPMGNFGRSLQATVAASGAFQVPNVPEGAYRLRLQSGRRGGVLHEEVVQVVADILTQRTLSVATHALGGTIRCDDGTDLTKLNGRVSLLPGITVAPENLSAWMRSNPVFDARLQAGTFRFETLATGNYLLVLTVPGRERTTLPVVVSGAQQLTVALGKVAAASPNGAGNGAPSQRNPAGR